MVVFAWVGRKCTWKRVVYSHLVSTKLASHMLTNSHLSPGIKENECVEGGNTIHRKCPVNIRFIAAVTAHVGEGLYAWNLCR